MGEEEVAERRMQESTSGQVLLQSDLARAEPRLERGRVRLVKVEAEVNNARSALKAFKFSKDDAEGLEMKRREKLAELESESRESEAKAEEAERAVLALQTQVTRLENQVLAEEGNHSSTISMISSDLNKGWNHSSMTSTISSCKWKC